ncbi:MAG: hypothetical protein WBE50_08180 [Methyloceanibacter sp.]
MLIDCVHLFPISLPFLGSLAERANFTPLVDREGSIVVVPPSNSDRKIRHYKRALRFMNKEGPTICAIAIAGVGSSPLGTAALARAVADALDTDVAGIITGYGLSDVMAEALGGWFAFSAADRIRYTMEKFFERMRATMPAGIVTAEGDASPSTLSEILLADPPELEYLVTHGKGSLVASRALQQYVEDLEGDNSKLFKRLRITTLGAVVDLPTQFKSVKQYLGTLDWFGTANSNLGVMHERVPGAGHHLNQSLLYHMSVTSLLNGGVAPRLSPKPAIAEGIASLSVPRVAAVRNPIAPIKATEAVRKPTRKPIKQTSAAPKASAAAKVAAPAPKVAAPTPKVTSPAPKVASQPVRVAPKVAVATAKAPVEKVKEPSIAAKPAIRLAAKKVAEAPRERAQPGKPKIAAVNGKLVMKRSKKEVR